MTDKVKIAGPYSVCIVNDPLTNKQIYLFGEYHYKYNYNPDMINFSQYLDNIFRKKLNKTFDFFLESSYYRDKHVSKPENHSLIFNVMKYFSPYFYDLMSNTNKNQWHNVRFHSIDIRNYMHDQKLQKDETCEYTILTSLFQDIYRGCITKLKMVHLNLIKKYIYDTINNKLYDIHILLENRWKIIETLPKFKKNLVNVYDKLKEHYQDELVSFLDEKIQNKKRSDMINDVFKDLMRKGHIIDKGMNMQIIWAFFTKYSVFFMDVYLIGRMYKTFKPSKESDIPVETAENIIVLAGCKHIEHLKKYFEKTNCQIIYENKNVQDKFVTLPNEMFNEK